MLEPFRLRVTADGVGTLGAVKARVELVNRAQPAPPDDDLPTPWAWYRGDDLEGLQEDDEVTSWLDRAGGAGDAEGQNPPKYTADAVGGQPGVSGSGSLFSSFATLGSADTAIAVVIGAVSGNSSAAGLDNPPEAGFKLVWDTEEILLVVPGGSLEDYSGVSANTLLVGIRDGDDVSIWVDGVKIADGLASGVNLASELSIQLAGFHTAAEFMYWNRALTPVEVGQVWAYAQDRYGL